MTVHFLEAANRHFSDAGYLGHDHRRANADQLYGLAAECALKFLMTRLGAPTTVDGELTEHKHRVHIDKLWDEFFVFVRNTPGTKYLSLLPIDNPFKDWSVDQRYWAEGKVLEKQVQQHGQGAKKSMVVLERAELDGVVW